MPRKTGRAARGLRVPDPASMRPRPDAAENHIGPESFFMHLSRFNEAAARCRGKLQARQP